MSHVLACFLGGPRRSRQILLPSAIVHLISCQLSFACMCYYMLQHIEALLTVTWLAEHLDVNWEPCCLCLCPSQEV